MGAFVLGVLVGWLAEWLFFTFWVKGGSSDNAAECDSLRSELNAKDNELVALKVELSRAVGATSTKSISSAKTDTKKTVTEKSSVTKKKSVAKESNTTKLTTKKSAEPKVKKKETPKKAATTKKSVVSKKVVAPKKSATTAKKAVKKAPAKKSAKAISGDDFTKLSGVGPSMSNTLKDLGITSYEKLAAMDDDILKDMLEASGAKLNNNKDAMSSWNEQATMAAKGDFSGLKKLQEALKKK